MTLDSWRQTGKADGRQESWETKEVMEGKACVEHCQGCWDGGAKGRGNNDSDATTHRIIFVHQDGAGGEAPEFNSVNVLKLVLLVGSIVTDTLMGGCARSQP